MVTSLVLVISALSDDHLIIEAVFLLYDFSDDLMAYNPMSLPIHFLVLSQ